MNSAETKKAILEKEVIGQKIKRMALEIAEQNTGEDELIIAGIVGNGVVVAQSIALELQKLLPVKIEVITVQLNKKDPLNVRLQPDTPIEGKVIILTDDVANTGRTMFYALKPFLNTYPKRLQTLVLVERSHKLFPIQTDYNGLSLATTWQEHIAVEAEGNEITGAWLY